jgi:hypothetical protein
VGLLNNFFFQNLLDFLCILGFYQLQFWTCTMPPFTVLKMGAVYNVATYLPNCTVSQPTIPQYLSPLLRQ